MTCSVATLTGATLAIFIGSHPLHVSAPAQTARKGKKC